MLCKTRLYILTFFYIWNSHNFAQATIDSKYTLASDEFIICDYSQLDSQLEALKTGQEMIQLQLDKQSEILQRFEQKFDKIPQRLEIIESNIRGQIKENFGETNDLISKQNQIMHADDKWRMIIDIKDIVKDHDVVFEQFTEKLNNVENILNKASWETSTRQLGDSISNKLTLLQNIDEKLTDHDVLFEQFTEKLNNVENILNKASWETSTRQLFDNISNKLTLLQNIHEKLTDHDVLFEQFTEKLSNVENILNKSSWETSTRQLGDSISNKLTLLQNIDEKLTNVNTITVDQNRNIQKNLNLTKAIKTTLETDDQLVCTTTTYPTSCAEFNTYHCANNKCRIYNQLYRPKSFLVACENNTEGDGWTVIQRRINGSVDFYRGWSDYKQGFGSIDGEFFIGLDKLHALTSTLQPMELMIQLQDFNETSKYAKYDAFAVGNESENYKLIKVGKYSGNATDSFSQHQGSQFTTKDRDNDQFTGNCAKNNVGAWWYVDCFWSNLNGKYYGKAESNTENGICWNGPRGCEYSLKFVEMMIRPKKI